MKAAPGDGVSFGRAYDTVPIQLLIKRGDRYMTVAVNYHGGLRYPHLERIRGTPALLVMLLAPRK